MSYALMSHRKVELTGLLNCVSLQQTQRSNEQYRLATNTLSLQEKMSSLQIQQTRELADYYKQLTNLDYDNMDDFKGLTDSETGAVIVEGYTSGDEIEDVSAKIQEMIKYKESKMDQELDAINKEIYLISVKENTVEMQVKRLDTQVSTLQKQLEAVEQAESSGIDRATPKFNGVG